MKCAQGRGPGDQVGRGKILPALVGSKLRVQSKLGQGAGDRTMGEGRNYWGRGWEGHLGRQEEGSALHRGARCRADMGWARTCTLRAGCWPQGRRRHCGLRGGEGCAVPHSS